MLALDSVVESAREAKARGATRFCMGAAWRGPKQRDLDGVLEMVKAVRALGMETCATLGMLRPGQAAQLKQAGLDFYNHNIDSSPEFYRTIVSTRSQDDRLDTLRQVREAGLHVCCGGIVGMRLGCLNHALLTAEAIVNSGLRLAGWVANHIDPHMAYPDENVVALCERLEAPIFARIPYDARDDAARLVPLMSIDVLR